MATDLATLPAFALPRLPRRWSMARARPFGAMMSRRAALPTEVQRVLEEWTTDEITRVRAGGIRRWGGRVVASLARHLAAGTMGIGVGVLLHALLPTEWLLVAGGAVALAPIWMLRRGIGDDGRVVARMGVALGEGRALPLWRGTPLLAAAVGTGLSILGHPLWVPAIAISLLSALHCGELPLDDRDLHSLGERCRRIRGWAAGVGGDAEVAAAVRALPEEIVLWLVGARWSARRPGTAVMRALLTDPRRAVRMAGVRIAGAPSAGVSGGPEGR